MALPLKPDPEWVKTLRKGDAVEIRTNAGRPWDRGVVEHRTAAGSVRVVSERGTILGYPRLCFNRSGYIRGGSRYLVAPGTP